MVTPSPPDDVTGAVAFEEPTTLIAVEPDPARAHGAYPDTVRSWGAPIAVGRSGARVERGAAVTLMTRIDWREPCERCSQSPEGSLPVEASGKWYAVKQCAIAGDFAEAH
jgi:hypothetical protein